MPPRPPGLIGRWALMAALVLGVAACSPAGSGSQAFQNIDITGAEYARDFALQDPQGRTRSLAEFRGRVVLVFFGYAQCPDVCPTTLAGIAEIRRALGPDGARVQPVFITVDPARDTPEIMEAYARSFGDDVVALRGSEEQTKATAKDFKVFYAKVAGSTPDTYTLDHTAGIYVYDPQGRLRLFASHGASTAKLLEDVKALLAGR